MDQSAGQNESPRWGTAIKLVVALSAAAIIIAMIMRFRSLIGPLLLIFVFSYLFYPVASWIHQKIRIPWPVAVTFLFTLILILFGGLLTWGGLAIFKQLQSFLVFIQGTVSNLPTTIAQITSRTYSIGTFTFDFTQFDQTQLINSVIGAIEPILSNIGSVLTSVAGGAAEVIGWFTFILLVSYFILLESRGLQGQLFKMEVPGYAADFTRLGSELGKIWNAFLRGQIIIIVITIVVYFVLLSILGVRFAIGLAFLAGMARFVPYAGPAIAWTTLGLVSYFQPDNYFLLSPFLYTVLTVGVAWFTDMILDNFVATRMLAKTLKVHPAVVMVMAIIGANLIGVVGMVLASPVTASLKLFWHYIVRKMFDLNPWDGLEEEEKPAPPPKWYITSKRLVSRLSKKWMPKLKLNQNLIKSKNKE